MRRREFCASGKILCCYDYDFLALVVGVKLFISLSKIDAPLVLPQCPVDVQKLLADDNRGLAVTNLRIGYTIVKEQTARYFFSGELCGMMNLNCSRCLSRYDYNFTEILELVLLPEEMTMDVREEELMLNEEDLKVHYYKEDCLDLGDIVREQLVLAVPMKPLCRKNCKGLCSVCGVNINEHDCGCERQNIDPRLAGLAEIRKKMTISLKEE